MITTSCMPSKRPTILLRLDAEAKAAVIKICQGGRIAMKDANGNPMFRKDFSKPKRQEEYRPRDPATVKREKDEAGWAALARWKERLIAAGWLKPPKAQSGDK
jgi:hypothetical protein